MSEQRLQIDYKPYIKRLEFYSKRLVESEFSGEFHTLTKHRGIEFEDFRDFTAGDDASLIDWKASLKGDKLLVRQYTQTKNLNVFFLIDVSNSMLLTSIDKLKCEYAAEVAASLSYIFIKGGDNVGFVMFNDKIVKYMKPNSGFKQFYLAMDTLSKVENYGGNFSLTNAIKFSSSMIKQGALVIIISDFIGLGKNWDKSIGILAKKADIIGIVVRDPMDVALNQKIGPAIIKDPYSNRIMFVDLDKLKVKYDVDSKEKLEDIEQQFKKRRGELVKLTTDKSFVKPIVKLFIKRRGKWQ